MSPSESKLKRSPYLSQMTRTADADLMATLSRPGESGSGAAVGSGGTAIAGGGVSKDFFHLRRPSTIQNELRNSLGGLQRNQRLSSLIKPNEPKVKKAASVTFTTDIGHTSQATIVSNCSIEADIKNSPSSFNTESPVPGVNGQMEESKTEKAKGLQYYYNPSMRCSAVSLDIGSVQQPSRTMTFQDMLDEGDGKEGDLNLKHRNEQWKTFGSNAEAVSTASKKRKHIPSMHPGGWVSTNDLALLRRSASRMKISAEDLCLGTKQNELSLMLNSTMQSKPCTIKRKYTEAVLTSAVSAGLAYGSDNIRMLHSFQEF